MSPESLKPAALIDTDMHITSTDASKREDRSMKTLLIVYHTMTGGTRQMAEAAAAAARDESGVDVRLQRADATTPEHVLSADAYLFATPENLAAMSGVMKDFFDRCYYPVLDRVNGRPYAAMICAGSDGQNALRQIDRIATGWRLNSVAPGLIVCTHAQTPERILAPKTIGADDLARCAELGAALAAGLALGIF
jgi:multimeric flavodoxin WrbA